MKRAESNSIQKKLERPTFKRAALSMVLFMAAIICVLVIGAGRDKQNGFVSFKATDNGSVSALIIAQNSEEILGPQEYLPNTVYNFNTQNRPSTYKLIVDIRRENAPEKNVEIKVDPATSSLDVTGIGFSDYKEWAISVDGDVFFPYRAFDWSGKAEISLPLYKKPALNLCFEARKADTEADMTLCHYIVRGDVS
jgi:hypothetical protein